MPGRSHPKNRYDALKIEVQRISQILEKIGDENEAAAILPSEIIHTPDRRPLTGTVDLRTAKWLLAEREARRAVLDAIRLDDTQWTILLDLYVAGRDHRLVAISSACIASGAPATTALRAIKILEGVGYVRRSQDRFDGRRVYLRLAPYTEVRIAQYLENLAVSLTRLINDQPIHRPSAPSI